jgi:hypothetical protein
VRPSGARLEQVPRDCRQCVGALDVADNVGSAIPAYAQTSLDSSDADWARVEHHSRRSNFSGRERQVFGTSVDIRLVHDFGSLNCRVKSASLLWFLHGAKRINP